MAEKKDKRSKQTEVFSKKPVKKIALTGAAKRKGAKE